MSEPLPPSALVEALEQAAKIEDFSARVSIEVAGFELDDGPVASTNGKLLRAAAAFIRSTMEAVEPFARAAVWFDHPNHPGAPYEADDEGVTMGLTVGDFRRLRTLTGATDER